MALSIGNDLAALSAFLETGGNQAQKQAAVASYTTTLSTEAL
jgi:hypothetical protein